MIKIKIIRREQQKVSSWAGGKTRQLAIYPQNAAGAEAFDFIFELTSSTMESEETEYTEYNGYVRILMLIEGATKLVHSDGRENLLAPYKQCAFDGGLHTLSRGKGTDYELTLKKDNLGDMKLLVLSGTTKIPLPAGTFAGLYCLKGCIKAKAANCAVGYSDVTTETIVSAGEGDQLLLFNGGEKDTDIRAEGEAEIIETHIRIEP